MQLEFSTFLQNYQMHATVTVKRLSVLEFLIKFTYKIDAVICIAFIPKNLNLQTLDVAVVWIEQSNQALKGTFLARVCYSGLP